MEGKHAHDCVKCGLKYIHYHPHKKADHPQFSFQCPNTECVWFYGKVNAANSPPASDTVTGRSTPESNASRPAETYAERSVRIAFAEGKLKCDKASHFIMKSTGGQYKVPVCLPSVDILDKMPIGKDAACDCERRACREAWSWNRPGVYENDWVQPGSYHKGYGKYEPSHQPRKVMPLRFNLTKEQISFLHDRHPGWLFVSVDGQMHDHPISHATTQVATYNLLHSLPAGRYLDLHGNPTSNERFNEEQHKVRVDTLVNIESSKDVLRSRTKWGPEFKKDGKTPRYVKSALRDVVRDKPDVVSSVDGLLSVHTLYYYHPHELPELIAASRGKTMTAIMHRFVGESGTLNNGEQSWKRITSPTGASQIVQTNAITGETYTHPDNERWFENFSYAPVRGFEAAGHLDDVTGLVWDANLCANGTYRLCVTSCTVREAMLDTSYKEPVHSRPPAVNSDKYVAKYNKVQISTLQGSEEVVIPSAFVPVFTELRLKMLGAATRDVKKYVAHSQYAALKLKGVMKEAACVDDVQTCYDIVYASFWVDAGKQRAHSAFIGADFRKQIVDTLVISLTSKSLGAGIAEALRSIRHRL